MDYVLYALIGTGYVAGPLSLVFMGVVAWRLLRQRRAPGK